MKALDYAKSATTAADILSGVFALLRDREVREFEGRDQVIHNVLFEARADHPLIEKYFAFSELTAEPFSPQVERGLSELQLGGIIGKINPTFDTIVIKPASVSWFREVVADRLEGDELSQLESIADLLREKVRPPRM